MDEDTLIIINSQLQIPLAEIEFRFSGSSGPGGQHVNKTATKATLLFDVATSPNLTEEQRATIMEKLANRIDSDGVLHIQAQSARSQFQNRELALTRFQTLLAQALQPAKPRKKTRPSRTAVEKRLTEKRKQSEKKRERRKGEFEK
ncbi:MAG: aminoacyl-tRNA hydrolase [Chloroflexi bacterium]|nr:aminoacyl-tRNA hydrolase [Ardenticatenaceae bacterium]MBL1130941.1 aminoacyl-tRNA hydrolase [Chloroflexota bacterium]NOG37037.1 aminoacyl-tRNA hydrolase [Chloroflexota bacterium]